MTENRFKNGQYENALQYTKEILNASLSMNDIISKNNTSDEKYEKDKDHKDNNK
ncbi:hypothetical protein [Paraclostridium bifermentans]|uniref:hypothetical protein n=1 Tax=Paraclostridium bifermentans TaxID=1490 RepID=UPI000A50CBB1|nr:hypothetical protein [Paraclostridium bifermentans]